MLDFLRNLPNSKYALPAFFAVLALVTVLIFSGNSKIGQLIGLTEQDSNLTNVQLLIETEANEPIQNAKVQFNSKGAPTSKFSTSSGYVEIEIPQRESVEIKISKDNYQTLIEIINLETDPNTNKKFQLKEYLSNQSLDYQYYTAQNDFFPLILSSLNPDYDVPAIQQVLEHIGINKVPLIARNVVFDSIERFKEETGNQETIQEAIQDSYPFAVQSSNREESSILFIAGDSGVEKRETQAELSIGLGEDSSCYFQYAPVSGYFKVSEDDAAYTSFTSFIDFKDWNSGIITQYPKLSDITKIDQAELDDSLCSQKSSWINQVIDSNPDERGFLGFNYPFIFDLAAEALGCGNFWSTTTVSPTPYVKFLDIINSSADSIKVESISYKYVEKEPHELTTADQRNILFDLSKEKAQDINISLRPENHFLIPIEFGFNAEPVKKTFQRNYANSIGENEIKKIVKASKSFYVNKPLPNSEYGDLQKVVAVSQRNSLNMELVDLEQDFIDSTATEEELFSSFANRFSVGSLLNVESIKINGEFIQMVPPGDEPTSYISTWLAAGSCPYLLVYNSEQNSWLETGTVLSAVKDKELQKTEVHSLSKNVSKIKLEEREPEITYIDALSVLYTDSQTKKTYDIAYPMAELQKVDNNFFLLRQGETFEVDLYNIIPNTASDVKLKINGYFEILSADIA